MPAGQPKSLAEMMQLPNSYHGAYFMPPESKKEQPATPWLKIEVPRADFVNLIAQSTRSLGSAETKLALDVALKADRVAALANEAQCNGEVCGCPAVQAGFSVHHGQFASIYDSAVRKYIVERIGLPDVFFSLAKNALMPTGVVVIALDDSKVVTPRVRELKYDVIQPRDFPRYELPRAY